MRALFLVVFLSLGLWAQTLLEEVKQIVGPDRYDAHRRLISVLFEREGPYVHGGGYDIAAICRTLEENNLLHPEAGSAQLLVDYGDISPVFAMKVTKEVLQSVGAMHYLTKEAVRDESGFRWRISLKDGAPDPVRFIERLRKSGGDVTGLSREEGVWHYRLDISDARIEAIPLSAGERRKIVRPLRPLWIDVSALRSLSISELPGSHWYPDVAVYDKMLNILSVHRSDERRGYLRLRLPEGARYVRIADRFTIDNLRSGLRLTADAAR